MSIFFCRFWLKYFCRKTYNFILASSTIILNLIKILGNRNKLDKEWCDQNIQYFDGTWIIPKR